MEHIKEAQDNVVGREISCPHCGMKNDRDRDTCWSCGEALTIKRKINTTVDLPLRYYVAAAFAYLAVFFGILILAMFVPIWSLMILCPPILAVWLAVCLSLIGGGLLLIALLGIWSALERLAAYLRQIAEGVSK